jgi:hypothetical protein
MDQNLARVVASHGAQGTVNRLLTRAATIDRGEEVEASKRFGAERSVVRRNDDLNRINVGVGQRGLDRPAQHRLATYRPVLLGQSVSSAHALAGGNDDRDAVVAGWHRLWLAIPGFYKNCLPDAEPAR